jgi:hypothetical protein
MEKIMEKLTMLESKLAETDQDEYDEPPQSPINAMITNMCANPHIQEALFSGVLGLLSGFANNGKPMTGVAGINVTAEITEESLQILDSLMKKGVSLEHLRKLDAMSNTKLQSLLIML